MSPFKKYFLNYCEKNKFEKNIKQLEIIDSLEKFIKKKSFFNFFSKKNKKKVLMNKGQVLIRKHNLWHRGTVNFSNKHRLLLSFIMIPKWRKINLDVLSEKLEIFPNFFKSTIMGRIQEFLYVRMFKIHTILKILKSFLYKIKLNV